MTSSNADFGHRMVWSARTLLTTLSGMPEVAGELYPNHVASKRTPGIARSASALIPPDFSRTVSSSGSPSQSFRSDSGLVKNFEGEYRDFVSSSPRSHTNNGKWTKPLGDEKWDELWSGLSASCTIGPRVAHTTPMWKRTSTGKVIHSLHGTPEWEWKHEWRRINTHVRREEPEQEHRMVSNTAPSTSTLGASRVDCDLNRPSPLARLHQVKDHLQPPREEEHKWLQDWNIAEHGRCDWNAKDDVQPERHNNQEPEYWYFACRRRICHHTLLRANENLTLDIRQRVCVHDACGYVSDTVESWLKHITSPHHELKSGTLTVEGEVDQSEYGHLNSDREVVP